MAENQTNIEERVRLSFLKVKEDINNLKKEFEDLKKDIEGQKSGFITLNDELKQVFSKIDNLSIKIDYLVEGSSGNDGVLTTNKQQTNNKQTTNKQQTNTVEVEEMTSIIDPIKKDIETRFLSLTNLEFKLFTTLYHLEEELNKSISYEEIASKMKISQSFLRGMIRELLIKKIPLTKRQDRNRKVSLSIPQEFRNLNLMANLIKFRQFESTQTTLFKY